MPEFPRVIEYDEVTIDTLLQAFSLAGLNSSVNGEEIWLRDDGAIPVKVALEPINKLIAFESSSGLNDSSSKLEKLEFINELNSANLVRFQMLYDSVLVGEYHLYYGDGLLTMQLLRTCKLFQFVFVNLLTDKYEDGGVLDIKE